MRKVEVYSTLFFKEKLNYFDTLQSFLPHSWIFKLLEIKACFASKWNSLQNC